MIKIHFSSPCKSVGRCLTPSELTINPTCTLQRRSDVPQDCEVRLSPMSTFLRCSPKRVKNPNQQSCIAIHENIDTKGKTSFRCALPGIKRSLQTFSMTVFGLRIAQKLTKICFKFTQSLPKRLSRLRAQFSAVLKQYIMICRTRLPRMISQQIYFAFWVGGCISQTELHRIVDG